MKDGTVQKYIIEDTNLKCHWQTKPGPRMGNSEKVPKLWQNFSRRFMHVNMEDMNIIVARGFSMGLVQMIALTFPGACTMYGLATQFLLYSHLPTGSRCHIGLQVQRTPGTARARELNQ
jgi:hypothetical protein